MSKMSWTLTQLSAMTTIAPPPPLRLASCITEQCTVELTTLREETLRIGMRDLLQHEMISKLIVAKGDPTMNPRTRQWTLRKAPMGYLAVYCLLITIQPSYVDFGQR